MLQTNVPSSSTRWSNGNDLTFAVFLIAQFHRMKRLQYLSFVSRCQRSRNRRTQSSSTPPSTRMSTRRWTGRPTWTLPECSSIKVCNVLLPPKLQRRGLVFKRKLVTVERVWWVTMERVIGYYRTCMQVTMIVHERLLWSVWGVTMKHYIKLMTEHGIWPIQVCANFIRPFFDSSWLL